MKTLLAVVLLALSLAAGAETRDPTTHFFDQKVGDLDLKADIETAKKEGKKGILFMFELDDCPFCHRMKTTVLNQAQVQDYYRKHFVIYPIDAKGDTPVRDFSGKEISEKQFALNNRVRATPVFIFYGLDGKPMTRFTGATKDSKEFLQLGQYVVEGAYKNQPFNTYKKQGG